jgi:outer membrane protein OmpA-like peptidoglycan-associated protein
MSKQDTHGQSGDERRLKWQRVCTEKTVWDVASFAEGLLDEFWHSPCSNGEWACHHATRGDKCTRKTFPNSAVKSQPRERYPFESGNSKAPVLVILGALALSAAVFFLFTKRKLESPQQAAAVSSPPAAAPTPTPTLTAPTEPSALPTTPGPAAIPPPQTFGFARPGDLGAQMAKALAGGDFEQAAKMLAMGDPTQQGAATALINQLFKELGYKMGPEDQVKILGQVRDATRLAIPLIKPGETLPSLNLQLDVVRDQKTGWKITQLRLPKELESVVADAMRASAPEAAAAPSAGGESTASSAPAGSASPPVMKGGTPLFVIEEHADALGFASGFVSSLLGHDFSAARQVIDETKVPPEKLAGLCIVFEEGDYELKQSKPLIITVASPNVSWVIAQVESEKLQQSTEFGVELQRDSEMAPWKVVGLNLSELLGSFAQAASKLGVPYTPIVQNPKGGESLALYFEYDEADLHQRAQKQLAIVAEMLKSDAKRKLYITGHTDAMGTDDYNIRLSQARAKNVKEQLAALGVSADQVVTEGLGKAVPLSPNQKADGSDDPEGRSRNRRAEIFLDF